MKIGLFRRFTPSDHPDLPKQFLQQLNNVIEDYATALTRNLTLDDNLRSEVVKVDLEHDTSTPIRLQNLKRNPVIGFLGYTENFDYADFTWEISPDENLTMNVKVKWASDPGEAITCTLVFLGGTPEDRTA